jgi:hypothetical protein
MMEAASTSETLVNCYQTAPSNIPEDSHLHTGCRENLKSHSVTLYSKIIRLDYNNTSYDETVTAEHTKRFLNVVIAKFTISNLYA